MHDLGNSIVIGSAQSNFTIRVMDLTSRTISIQINWSPHTDKLISNEFAHVFPESQLIHIQPFNNLHLNTKDYSDSSDTSKRKGFQVLNQL